MKGGCTAKKEKLERKKVDKPIDEKCPLALINFAFKLGLISLVKLVPVCFNIVVVTKEAPYYLN